MIIPSGKYFNLPMTATANVALTSQMYSKKPPAPSWTANHTEFHSSSCRNRNCPNCQAIQKEVWVDKQRAEVIDSSYFHVVFTMPNDLNSLFYCNQKLLYSLFHKCCADTLLGLSANPKYLGAAPGIIQVLHTWNQELSYHIHLSFPGAA